MKSARKKAIAGKVLVYAILILIAVLMIIPFIWMLSASIKSDREVFQMNPFVLIPENPKFSNYHDIWTKIPMLKFAENTVFLQSLTLSIKTPCFLPTSRRLRCLGRFTWCRSLL